MTEVRARGPGPPQARVSGQAASRRTARRWLFASPPPGAFSISGWALLPLRAFLGVTFSFAGLQKLANPNFLNPRSPSGIQAQMIAAVRSSPLHALLGHLLQFGSLIGVLIALSELAVGLSSLLGLWTRAAALGGAVLSLTLFLTVSFHSSPYYTGADIVFLFAWSPLLLAGAGGVLSLDAVIASWTRHEVGLGSPIPVPVRFSLVQQVCGSFEDERCRARRGAPCNPRGCPFLPEPRRRGSRVALDAVDRRAVILGGAAAGATAGIGLISAGLVAGIGRLAGGVKAPSAGSTAVLSAKAPLEGTPGTSHAASTPGTSHAASTPGTPGTSTTGSGPTGGAVPSGTPIGPAAEVPVGGAARFTDPASGDPGLVLQLSRGTFVAYDAVCPHAGCTVGYSSAADVIVCPCHGSEFSPDTGSVEVGPAPRGLTVIPVQEGPDGQLYVDG